MITVQVHWRINKVNQYFVIGTCSLDLANKFSTRMFEKLPYFFLL